jgi:hypothetical protein
MYASDFFEQKILNVFNGTTATAATNLYVALFASDPTETGTGGTEINYPEYTRMAITFTAPYAESGGIGVKNDTNITWATASVAGGQATFIALFDSNVVGAGNMWAYGQLTEPLSIDVGEQPVLYAGDVLFYLTGAFSTYLKTAVLNLWRGTNITGITPYVALYNGDPEGTGAELSGGAYARPTITFTSPAEQTSGQSLIQNATETDFPAPTAAWGNWTYDGLFDAASNGHLLVKFQNQTPKNILKNYIVAFPVGSYKLAVN